MLLRRYFARFLLDGFGAGEDHMAVVRIDFDLVQIGCRRWLDIDYPDEPIPLHAQLGRSDPSFGNIAQRDLFRAVEADGVARSSFPRPQNDAKADQANHRSEDGYSHPSPQAAPIEFLAQGGDGCMRGTGLQ